MSTENLETLLDIELDDLADLPEFVTPPAGAYSYLGEEFSAETDDKSGTVYVHVKFKLMQTLELVNPDDTPVPDGTVIDQRFDLGNEWAQGALKKITTAYKEGFDITKLSQMGDVFPGSEGGIVLGTRAGKVTEEMKLNDEKPRVFTTIKTISLG